jgi:Flp pilus assembly CpaE family ATPase
MDRTPFPVHISVVSEILHLHIAPQFYDAIRALNSKTKSVNLIIEQVNEISSRFNGFIQV